MTRNAKPSYIHRNAKDSLLNPNPVRQKGNPDHSLAATLMLGVGMAERSSSTVSAVPRASRALVRLDQLPLRVNSAVAKLVDQFRVWVSNIQGRLLDQVRSRVSTLGG